jgi:hypothetical protein
MKQSTITPQHTAEWSAGKALEIAEITMKGKKKEKKEKEKKEKKGKKK